MGYSVNYTDEIDEIVFDSAVMRLLYASVHQKPVVKPEESRKPEKVTASKPQVTEEPVPTVVPEENKKAGEDVAGVQTTEEQPAAEQTVSEKIVEKQFVEEKTADEKPAQEQLAEAEAAVEQPVVEQPVVEQPVEEIPAEEAQAEVTEEVEEEEETEVEEETDVESEEEEETEEEKIEIRKSFWGRLREGLSKTKNAIFGSIDSLLKNFVKVDEDLLDELEELLISSDIGVNATEEIIDELRERIKDGRLKDKDQVISSLKEILTGMIGEEQPLCLDTTPSVILVIGVNGAGKTTSIGKISKRLRLSGKKVVVAAADTFRAAAIDQLAVWCERAKVELVRQNEGSDPAAVVYDAIGYAKKKNADVLLIDTAGRLHNKKNLMNELTKIDRVIDRELPGASRENLLVLDATTGQNAIMQAKEFKTTTNITGITLNKLDGTAKGGIVISIKQELGIPVKFIGVGEKIDDMQEFDAAQFVDALFKH